MQIVCAKQGHYILACLPCPVLFTFPQGMRLSVSWRASVTRFACLKQSRHDGLPTLPTSITRCPRQRLLDTGTCGRTQSNTLARLRRVSNCFEATTAKMLPCTNTPSVALQAPSPAYLRAQKKRVKHSSSFICLMSVNPIALRMAAFWPPATHRCCMLMLMATLRA